MLVMQLHHRRNYYYVMSFWNKWLKYSILVDFGLSQKLST